MGIYDSLLASSQYGYDTVNQNAMAQAQMPTFADKFLAGLRGGQDQAYKQQMGMGQLQMNMAYKQAQERQMQETSLWHKRQRDLELAKYISENKTGENGPEVQAFVQSQGGDLSLIPQLRYQQTYVTAPSDFDSAPSLPGMSLSEGAEQTSPDETVVGQVPIEWSDWGAQAAFKQKGLDLREQMAQMSLDSKRWLAEHKMLEPKDALAKLDKDFILSQGKPWAMNSRDYNARKFFITAKVDPTAAALVSQGVYPKDKFASAPSILLPGQQQNTQMPIGGGTSDHNTPNLPSAVVKNNVKGVTQQTKPTTQQPVGAKQPGSSALPGSQLPKLATAAAEEEAKLKGVDAGLGGLAKKLKEILSHPGLEYGSGTTGMVTRLVGGQKWSDFELALDSIKSDLGLNALAEGVKLGSVTEAEHTLLQNKIRNLNPKQSTEQLVKNLKEIAGIVNNMKKNNRIKAQSMAQSRGYQSGLLDEQSDNDKVNLDNPLLK